MYSDQAFLLLSAAAALLEMGGGMLVWERKMKQAEQREREAEQRRRARLHDDYCTQETARLYRERGTRQ